MPFKQLANLIASYCNTNGGVAKPSAQEIFEIVNTWIKAGRPIPEGWNWEKRTNSTPIDFLLSVFDPLLIPLIVSLKKSGERYDTHPLFRLYVLIALFTKQELSISDQKILLELFTIDLHKSDHAQDEKHSKKDNLLHEVVTKCEGVQKHLLMCFVEAHINLDQVNEQGDTALHIALRKDDHVTAQVLIELGASLKVGDAQKITAQQIIDQNVKPALHLMKSFKLTKEEKEAQRITESEFQTAVKKFLQTHKTTIPEIFSREDSRYPLLRDGFLIDPTIQGYLARAHFQITEGDIPVYSELEKSVLVAMQGVLFIQSIGEEIHHIPYRSDPKSVLKDRSDSTTPKLCYERFYHSGTSGAANELVVKNLRKKLGSQGPIYLLQLQDVYVTGEVIEKIARLPGLRCNGEGFSYIISATIKDGHITAMLSVINAREQRVFYHVLLNSWQSKEYLDYLSPKLDQMSGLNTLTDDILVPPLLDASFDIQTNKEDSNCSLYTWSLCEALAYALETDTALQHTLAQVGLKTKEIKVEYCIGRSPTVTRFTVASEESWQVVVGALDTAIKPKAPMIFESNESGAYVPRSYESRKKDFLKVRWETGNLVYRKNVEKTRLQLISKLEQAEKLMKTIGQVKHTSVKDQRVTLFQAVVPQKTSKGESQPIGQVEPGSVSRLIARFEKFK